MEEKDLLNNIGELDKILAEVRNPSLTRNDHDNIRQLMNVILQRVKLSFKLEKELKDQEESKREG